MKCHDLALILLARWFVAETRLDWRKRYPTDPTSGVILWVTPADCFRDLTSARFTSRTARQRGKMDSGSAFVYFIQRCRQRLRNIGICDTMERVSLTLLMDRNPPMYKVRSISI